ncbi:WhiB family transcriptional regulator [Streptomyces sp. NPDC013178]|uniref:WhiB family transcriptional regulator n=1 Tax=Streptomyces sp. NPDC013178 TaxID=3155118 RepID=UPI0033DA0AB7
MNWRYEALCRYGDPDLFFPVGNSSRGPALLQIEEAKAVCRRCPVRSQCLERAMEDGAEGVWGGTTEAERRAMRRRLVRETAHGSGERAA